MREILTYEGRPVETMNREELIRIVYELWRIFSLEQNAFTNTLKTFRALDKANSK